MPPKRKPRAYFRRSDRAPRCRKCGRIHKWRSEEDCTRKIKPRTKHPKAKRVNAEGKRLYAPYGYNTTIERFGKLLTWVEMTPSERYVTSRRIAGAHHRNDYWRENGFPNMAAARAVSDANRKERVKSGRISPQRQARLRRIAAGEISGDKRRREAETARLFVEGEREREQQRAQPHQGTKPMLGGLVAAGLYDPKYLERREMRILDVMGRMPQ